ncbi:MAG: hypothetical protein HZA93_24175 [Verrucomicrobia bacterium]|nr:hypothetical protein [Verrucomicrobiota bacterium]
MSFLTASERDLLRHLVLAELVATRAVALSAEMLARRVQRSRQINAEFELADVQAEIEALHAAGFVAVTADPVSRTPFYQASTAGVAAHGRA